MIDRRRGKKNRGEQKEQGWTWKGSHGSVLTGVHVHAFVTAYDVLSPFPFPFSSFLPFLFLPFAPLPPLPSSSPLFLLPSLSFLPPSPSFLSPFRPSLLSSQVLRNVQLESALLRAELTLHQREEAFRAVEGRNQRLQRDVAQSHLASSRAVKQFERRTTEGTFTSGQTSVYCYFILSLNLANQRNENFANPIMLQAIILK